MRTLSDGTIIISFEPQRNALSNIQKVEIVNPAPSSKKAWYILLQALIGLNLRVLIVFWFVASWFPELGLTYWALILPVYIAMWIFRAPTARQIPERFLKRHFWRDPDTGECQEDLVELITPKVKPLKK